MDVVIVQVPVRRAARHAAVKKRVSVSSGTMRCTPVCASSRSASESASGSRTPVVIVRSTSMASAYASRRRARLFDNIPFPTLARAYAEHLGKLFVHADDLGFRPSRILLATVGLRPDDLAVADDLTSVAAAERAADRTQVIVEAL